MFIPLPTKRGKVIIVLAIVTFTIAIVNPNPATSLIISIFIGLIVSSFLFSFTSISGINVIRLPSADGIKGEMLIIPLKIINNRRYPRQTIIIREDTPFSLKNKFSDFSINNLLSSEKRNIERLILSDKRGTYNLNKLSLIGGDALGIFKRTKHFYLPREIVIYPPTVRISQIPIEIKREIKISNNGRPIGASGQWQEVFGIREYRLGDPVRLIHWKASAKQGKLVVKEFETHTIPKINILLDVDKSNVSANLINNNFEYLVSTAASIVHSLSGAYCKISIIAGKNNKDFIIEAGIAYHIEERIMNILANITPNDITIEDVVNKNKDIFQHNSILYCLTLSQNEISYQICSDLIEKGIDLRWICAPKESFQLNKNKSEKYAIAPNVVSPDTHIEDAILTI